MDITTPKVVTRWKGGVPTRTEAVPTPFNQERAEEIFQLARQKAPWAENLDNNMTDGEIAYVKALWDTMPGNTCFWDAFNRIRLGRLQ
jgi:hypothetical protein